MDFAPQRMTSEKAVNATLADALKQLDLEPGETRRVTVNGYLVEVRRLPPEEEPDYAHQVMLQPWCEIPDPPAVRIVRATPGPIHLPDPPNLDDLAPGDLTDYD